MKEKHPLTEAQNIAEKLVDKLRPACERIEIAGSIRRQKAEIGDIEIVAIPKYLATRNLFGDPVNEISLIDQLLEESKIGLTKDGPKYKQFNLITRSAACIRSIYSSKRPRPGE